MLSEIPQWSVLLLEAGGEEPFLADVPGFLGFTWGTRVDWRYEGVPGVICGGVPCPITRGKGLGGSSSINAMLYIRGNKMDYDYWARTGNTDWDFEHVLQYFKKSENNLDPDIRGDTEYHGVDGYLNVGRFPYQNEDVNHLVEALREIGYAEVDCNGKQQSGFMIAQATQKNSIRQSTNRAFLEPILKRRPNLKVVTNVRVTKILIHPQSVAAYGVEYVLEGNRHVAGSIFATKEVIVSGGAVNSPQLLMLSGVGPKEVLQPLGIPVMKDLKVGENLQDHASTPGVFFTREKHKTSQLSDILMDFLKYSEPKKEGLWASTGVNQLIAYINTKYANKSIDHPDVMGFFIHLNPKEGNEIDKVVFFPTVLRPKSRGKIIINSTDPFSSPLIYQNYFSELDDIKIHIDACNIAKQLAETSALKNAGYVLNTTFLPTENDFKTGKNPLWRDPEFSTLFSNFHLCGTCKMGPYSDRNAVVDPALRVHGVARLRVIDASVMPYIVSGNLNAPTVMIAEKGADIIKRHWRHL
ncbi:glucose dehydrogenase [FAD, quinone]-like isoform X2 [Zootermopsis nevadensis]|uniref:glucose dehydrogenase [FAD, quinone]-like isoform X2 n=1 Tax=Zootermopsis nevadensis TaxID=136037 RepID=UPI000B8E7761|nr:glucose dehydrogenase [FAD, quinone]-like isoform X2 [Zootermopsis nevadensis]